MQPTDEFDEFAIRNFNITVERRKNLLEKIGKDPATSKFKRVYRQNLNLFPGKDNIKFLTNPDS
jgi:hypothetical protein